MMAGYLRANLATPSCESLTAGTGTIKMTAEPSGWMEVYKIMPRCGEEQR